MRKNLITLALSVLLIALSLPATAQQPKKVARIGYLGNTAATSAIDMKAFHKRMSDLGYSEGQNITIEYRYFDGKVERLPELAAELIQLKPEVIVVVGNEAALAVKNVTKKIPVVMLSTSDAVTRGFVASLARPGGNITGLTSMGAEINGKRLELLKEIVPKLSRVGYLWSSTSPVAADNLKETETVARALRLEFFSLEAKVSADIEKVFQTVASKRADALLVEGGAFMTVHQKQIIELALKHRLPTMYPNARYVDAGGLMTYSGDRSEQYRRAADYVDKILKGTKPADIPVERPKKFELIINLKTAKQIGLTVPPNVLARADRVIR
jgi:putative tryptophan/tyrosine transport system substrate-binding protein